MEKKEILTGESKRAVKTVSVMIFAMTFSKLLGLLRVVLTARFLADSPMSAAFYTASRIPLTFFDLLLGAAVLGVFIPVYNSIDISDDASFEAQKQSDEFANIFISLIFLLTSVLSLLGILFSDQIIHIITPGYTDEMLAYASQFLKILFPMIIFTGSTYTLIGVLQSKNEFLIPAFISSVSNLGIILYFLFLHQSFGVYGLCVAYLFSWFTQLLTLLIPLYKNRKKYDFKYKFKINFKNEKLIKSVRMALPIMAGSWLVPVGLLAGHRFASECESSASAVSSFEFSTQLFLLITGILTYGICNYIFPKLSQNSGEESTDIFNNIVRTGLSSSFFLIVPVSVLVYVLKSEAVTVILMHGKFTPELAAETISLFSVLIPAMIFFSVIEILNRVYYAKKMVIIPMAAALSGIMTNIVCGYIFIIKLGLQSSYIAVSNLFGLLCTFLVLALSLNKKLKNIYNKQLFLNLLKITVASLILFLILSFSYKAIGNNALEGRLISNIILAALFVITGLAVFIVTCVLLRTNETEIFMDRIKSKRRGPKLDE